MSFTEETEYETWHYPGKGRVQIIKLDAHGQRRAELIAGGRKFQVSPRERRMNQELAANDRLDIFANGTVVPLTLTDKSEDKVKFETNPNLMNDDEVSKLFKTHWKTFERRIEDITNVGLLERLITASQESDSAATVRQVELLRKRMTEVDPSAVTETEPQNVGPEPSSGIRAVTPR